MINKPSCTIIIRAYNEEEHLGRLLTGIEAQTVKNVQVILVDSGSTDRTVEIGRQYKTEVVSIHPDEFTFGRSLNMGIAEARADIVIMASAHVYPVYPDWLSSILDAFKDNNVGLVYGKQRGAEKTQFSEHQIFHQWFPEHSVRKQATPFCNNANAAIRRSLWQEHPYDETLPGLEDLAWGRWVLEKGYSISYLSEAEVIHVHNESLDGIFNRYKREGMAFKRIYPHENFTRRDQFRLFFQNIFNDWREAGTMGRLKKDFWNILRFRWYQFSGTYHGYKQSGPLTWQLKQAFYYPHQRGAASPQKTRQVEPIRYHELLNGDDKMDVRK
jgi:glycosyltransferase involved in cell wall biosynthesis